MTLQQHPDAEVSKAHIAILVLTMSNESLQSNQGPTQELVTKDLTGINELKNYFYVVSIYKGYHTAYREGTPCADYPKSFTCLFNSVVHLDFSFLYE